MSQLEKLRNVRKNQIKPMKMKLSIKSRLKAAGNNWILAERNRQLELYWKWLGACELVE